MRYKEARIKKHMTHDMTLRVSQICAYAPSIEARVSQICAYARDRVNAVDCSSVLRVTCPCFCLFVIPFFALFLCFFYLILFLVS